MEIRAGRADLCSVGCERLRYRADSHSSALCSGEKAGMKHSVVRFGLVADDNTTRSVGRRREAVDKVVERGRVGGGLALAALLNGGDERRLVGG